MLFVVLPETCTAQNQPNILTLRRLKQYTGKKTGLVSITKKIHSQLSFKYTTLIFCRTLDSSLGTESKRKTKMIQEKCKISVTSYNCINLLYVTIHHIPH